MAKVIVTGSLNMDLAASVTRHPNPGETVSGSALRFFAGGKGANQAIASARAGAATFLLGNIGDDPFGGRLTSFLDDAGVDVSAVRAIAGVPTGVALIVVDARGENSIVVIPGANGHLAPADVDRVTVARGDVMAAQLEVPIAAVAAALTHARARGATTLLNPSPAREIDRELHDLVDVLVVNEQELDAIVPTGRAGSGGGSGARDIETAVSGLGRGERITVVTRGALGAIAFSGRRVLEVPGRPVVAVDTTGAGDCFAGCLAARLAQGDELEAALQLANAAASICVERPGAGPSMPTLAEVRARMP